MSSSTVLEAYFLTGIIVTLLCFACGEHNSKSTDVGQHTTDKHYDQLQHLTDDDSLITTVEKPPRQHPPIARAHQSKITDIIVQNIDKIPLKRRENKLRSVRGKKARFSRKKKQFLRKIQHSKNWLSRVVKEKANSKKIIRRKSRDDGDNGDENIQSKDEDEDEDVQLIIIPRKPRKHLQPKIQEEEDENNNEGFRESEHAKSDSENDDRVSENSIDESENYGENSEDKSGNYNRDSKFSENTFDNYGKYSKNSEDSRNSEDDSENYENSQNSRKVSKKPYFVPKNFRNRFKNYRHVNYKNVHRKPQNTNDDATLSLERVVPEEVDDNDSKNSRQSEAGDYDLHLKVKDKSGTKVKLSGDLPGNIGTLVAVEEDGRKVQIKNTGKNSRTKGSEDLKIVNSQGGSDDQTTDEMAQNLINIKSGKLKHSPYPSTILLKPDGGMNENPKLPSDQNSNQDPVPIKAQSSDEPVSIKAQSSDEDSPQTLSANTLTSFTRGEANAKAEQPANQQPSNNIFAPMEFENGDDELMATSRLLDIAQKADDVSSLKEVKDPPNTVKESSETTKSLKEFTKGTSPPIVLPDETIHGTQRHHFEIHDLTDISGGKWKAVHIPDHDIASMLEIANQKQGGKIPMDIQHEDPGSQEDDISGVQMPVEVHGRVHAFEHNLMKNKSKNSTTASVGKLIVATENEHRGKEVGSLHTPHPSVIKLRGYMKEEGPKSREIIHRKTSAKPSLVVAKIPEDDGDDSDDLPLRKLPTPIVAPLRKTRPLIKPGSMRSHILAGIIHPADKPRVLLTSPITTASNGPKKSSVSQNISTSQNEDSKSMGTNNDPEVLEKIKSLLLKSSPSPKKSPVNTNAKSQNSQDNLPASTPNNIPPASQLPKKVFPTIHPNNDGLFLPPKLPQPTDAFSNHASVLNRISEPKREALLIGIIKALLARERVKTSSASSMRNGAVAGLPHYNRQAILQGLQNLQMRKTVSTALKNDDALSPGLETGNPGMPGKNLDEIYQKEREQEVKQELARANEEAFEAKKMRQEESQMLSNFDHFSNPESRSNWGKIAGAGGPQQSQTPDGQVLSMLGPQQLNMLEDNPSAT